MSDSERPIVEELLDYAVFAPLGLALTIVEDLPQLVEKGRARIATQVGIARFVGRIAVGRARRRLDDLLAPDPHAETASAEAPLETAVTSRVVPATAAAEPSVARSGGAADSDLAIPGYDTLAASQVVARLAGLSDAELEAVRDHEAGHRGRRTILARISQLEEERRAG